MRTEEDLRDSIRVADALMLLPKDHYMRVWAKGALPKLRKELRDLVYGRARSRRPACVVAKPKRRRAVGPSPFRPPLGPPRKKGRPERPGRNEGPTCRCGAAGCKSCMARWERKFQKHVDPTYYQGVTHRGPQSSLASL